MKSRDVYGRKRYKVYRLNSGKEGYRVKRGRDLYPLYFLNEGVYKLNTTGLIYLCKVVKQVVPDYYGLLPMERELLGDFSDGNTILKSNVSDIPGGIQYNGYLDRKGDPNRTVTALQSMMPYLKKSD